MSTATTLDKLKEFLEEKVSPSIQIQKAEDNNVQEYKLVNPSVHVGWIPPKGYLPPEMEAAIPCLIVGLDEGNDDGDSSELKIRISAAVFSPGTHEPAENGVKYTPNFKGYIDLLNLIDITKAQLVKNQIIKKEMILQMPIKWGMYVEQPYPYWYGWVTLTVQKQSYPKTNIEKLLLER